jgi:hypothetical protein
VQTGHLCGSIRHSREHAVRRIRRNLGRGRRGHHPEEAFFIVFLLLKAQLRGAPKTSSSLDDGISSIAYDNFKYDI